jgi:Uma2 family endonuclease
MGNEQAIRVEQEPRLHRITVEEFLALDEAGFFAEVGRVELIDGEIFEMAPLYRPHARTLLELTVAVGLAVRELGPAIEALTPVSARLDPHSLPEADIVIATADPEDKDDFVTADTALLLVEVSASSLRHDLGRKLRLYARTGVPEYWVADVNGRTLLRFHAPVGEAYTERAEFAFGATVPSATIPGLSVDTARLA